MERSPNTSVNDYDSLDEVWGNKDGERHICAPIVMTVKEIWRKMCIIYYKNSIWRPGPMLETAKNMLLFTRWGLNVNYLHKYKYIHLKSAMSNAQSRLYHPVNRNALKMR